jgi:hypothetical protein
MNTPAKKSPRLHPCKVCGSRKITLKDCGYSSFNPGGGVCENGHEVSGEAGCLPTQSKLARIWNRGQQLTPVECAELLRRENKRLCAALRTAKARVRTARDAESASLLDRIALQLTPEAALGGEWISVMLERGTVEQLRQRGKALLAESEGVQRKDSHEK